MNTPVKIYLAPMEGLTGYVYRNAYNEFFGGIDRYFTPFIASKKLNSKEKNDILPEHNTDMDVVPQILTNKTDEFLAIARQLKDRGYETVNLNLGCPSGTVVAKNRGAGFLGVPDELEIFLDEIFEKCPVDISIKTRIGRFDVDEWENLLNIYNKFPIKELIVHPRLQTDFYNGHPRLEAFEMALEKSRHDLCYNGDICSVSDYEQLMEQFPDIQKIMIGRGILRNPYLALLIKGETIPDGDTLLRFHNKVYQDYKNIMSGDRNTLFKMKELWVYFGSIFADSDRILKQIRKADTCLEYEIAVNKIFSSTIYVENNIYIDE